MGLPVSAEKPKLYRDMHDGIFRGQGAEVHLDRAFLRWELALGTSITMGGWIFILALGTRHMRRCCRTGCFVMMAVRMFRM